MKNESKNGWNRWNLGQNSRWNINLLLKINFSRWVKNWEQSGHWIAILPLDRHITIGITSKPLDQHGRDLGCQITLHEGGEISPKNQRYITDFLPLEAIFWKNLRYIGDISRYFPPWWIQRVKKYKMFWEFDNCIWFCLLYNIVKILFLIWKCRQ